MDGCGFEVKEEGVIGTGGSDIFALERRAPGALERSGKVPGARSGRAKISVEKSPPAGARFAAQIEAAKHAEAPWAGTQDGKTIDYELAEYRTPIGAEPLDEALANSKALAGYLAALA